MNFSCVWPNLIKTPQKEIMARYLINMIECEKKGSKISEAYKNSTKELEDFPDSMGWFSDGYNVLADINLDLPDEILIEYFKNFLPWARKIAKEQYNQYYNNENDDFLVRKNNESKSRGLTEVIRRTIKNSDIKNGESIDF